jgi:hypothetical protein
MSRKLRNVIMFSILATSLAASVAVADTDSTDSKVYTGSFCIGRVNTSTVIDNWRGRMFNLDSIGHWVHCPFVRDIVRWGGTVNAWVKVVDRHYSDDLHCGLWSQNVDSSDGWSGYIVSRSSSGSSTGVQTLNFPTLSNYSANSSYIMECLVPGKYSGNASQIVAYSMIEN